MFSLAQHLPGTESARKLSQPQLRISLFRRRMPVPGACEPEAQPSNLPLLVAQLYRRFLPGDELGSSTVGSGLPSAGIEVHRVSHLPWRCDSALEYLAARPANS